MSDIIKATLIVVVGLMLAALLNGGVYQMVVSGAGSGGSFGSTEIWAYRLNRFTGEVVPFSRMARLPVREASK